MIRIRLTGGAGGPSLSKLTRRQSTNRRLRNALRLIAEAGGMAPLWIDGELRKAVES